MSEKNEHFNTAPSEKEKDAAEKKEITPERLTEEISLINTEIEKSSEMLNEKGQKALDGGLQSLGEQDAGLKEEGRSLIKRFTARAEELTAKYSKKLNPFANKELKDSVENITQKAIEEAENLEIKPENRNEKGELLAPNGEVSNLQNELHWKMARTEAFKKWFGDWEKNPGESSKIVDGNGEPLVVYHGSKAEKFEGITFNPKKAWGGRLGKGVYFTPYVNYSVSVGHNLFFCFLNLKKVDVRSESSFGRDSITRPVFQGNKGDFSSMAKNMASRIRTDIIGEKERGGVSEIPVDSYRRFAKEKYSEAERFGEIAVNNKDDIMIIPMPILKNTRDTYRAAVKDSPQAYAPGHKHILKEETQN